MIKRMIVPIGSLMILAAIFLFLIKEAPALASPEDATPQGQTLPLTTVQTATVEFGGLLGFIYSPREVRISPGDRVEWLGDFAMHPLVSDDGLWQVVNTGTQFSYTFDQPGTYNYHCLVHDAFGMRGVVRVGYNAYLPLIER